MVPTQSPENKARDWIKRSAKQGPLQPEDIPAHPTHDERRNNETSADLEAILRRLPQRSRTVLTLHYLEEFVLAEIAAILHVPKGTVKSRLHTARTEFKKLWRTSDEIPQAHPPADMKGETK